MSDSFGSFSRKLNAHFSSVGDLMMSDSPSVIRKMRKDAAASYYCYSYLCVDEKKYENNEDVPVASRSSAFSI
jgi:hypothetical protein